MPEAQLRPTRSPEQESLERLRRIETRITTLAIGLGVEMATQKPVFDKQPGEHATVELPSANSSMKEILKAIPGGFTGRVRLVIGSDTVATMDVVDRTC